LNISKETLDKVALSEKEYELIVQQLGREPAEVELGMFGSLWSEHCGYKHSKALLKFLPSRGKHVLVGPGEENAGVVDIGDGQVVVMKMESHNHPSAIEPYQGAATGVGGIVRDIFTMGARPIALLNSLRFGPLTESHNRYLFNGVVAGIAGYGNCLGIPDVGGEVFFADCYSANPLVNALCLGIAEKDKLVGATAGGKGNLLMLVGADTGRTGWIVGMQDLGAAGLTSSVVESVARGGGGVEIDVLKVPRREESMSPHEVMLSESQERMLVIVNRGCENKIKSLFDHWELRSNIIGQVTDSGLVVVKAGEETVAEIPVNLLVSPPLYRRRSKRPAWLAELQSFDASIIPDVKPRQCNSTLLRLLASPNIASKECVYRQYDHQVMDNSVVLPGGDAAVLRIKGTRKGISLTADGNGRCCYIDPFLGGVIAVAEAARNLVCSGAEPLAITDCLNFGNPERDEVYYQLKECIKGMARACRELRIPVISGNVSLYNETKGEAVYPTPVIGMVGVVDNINRHCTMSFKDEGDVVFLLSGSEGSLDGSVESLGGSEYLQLVHGLVKGKPAIDLSLEKRVQRCCLEAIKRGIIKSAHDCSEGGLAVAIAESCVAGDIGFSGDWEVKGRLDSTFFGEYRPAIVVSIPPDSIAKMNRIARRWQVPLTWLGEVGGKRLLVKRYIDLSLAEAQRAWQKGLKRLLV